MDNEPVGGANQDFCVCCGRPVPEGRMVCLECYYAEIEREEQKKEIDQWNHG